MRDIESLGLGFTDEELEEFTTLGAFMLAKLQRIPKGGEFVNNDDYRFTVVDVEKNRIVKVRVEKASQSNTRKVSA